MLQLLFYFGDLTKPLTQDNSKTLFLNYKRLILLKKSCVAFSAWVLLSMVKDKKRILDSTCRTRILAADRVHVDKGPICVHAWALDDHNPLIDFVVAELIGREEGET